MFEPEQMLSFPLQVAINVFAAASTQLALLRPKAAEAVPASVALRQTLAQPQLPLTNGAWQTPGEQPGALVPPRGPVGKKIGKCWD